jgi:hypothetical protein
MGHIVRSTLAALPLALSSCGPGLDEGENYAMPVAAWRCDFVVPSDADEWTVWDRCNARWQIESGVMVQSSNCGNENSPVPEARLGTMLVRDDQPFDGGWLAAHVYSGERRSIGIAYGPSTHDLLRVRLDTLDRVLAFEHVYAPPYLPSTGFSEEQPSSEVLAIREDIDLPHRRWYWLAVRREGDTHEVWVDGAKMLEVTLSMPDTDTIGIYSYGNIDARVDWVARFSLEYTPWETLP